MLYLPLLVPHFCSWVTRKSYIFCRIPHAGCPGFHKLSLLDSLQLFLEHSLELTSTFGCKAILKGNSSECYTGLPVRTGGWRFPPATMTISPGYFWKKQKEGRTKSSSLLFTFPPTTCIYPTTWKLSDRPAIKWCLLLFSYIVWKFLDHYCQAACLKCVNYWRLRKKGPSEQLSLHTNHLWLLMSQAATQNQSQRGLFLVDQIWKKAFPVDSGNTTRNLNSCQGAVWKSWHAVKVFILVWHRNRAEGSLL